MGGFPPGQVRDLAVDRGESITAQDIAMRELREPDAFPAADLGLLRALTDSEGKRLTSGEPLAMAARWRP